MRVSRFVATLCLAVALTGHATAGAAPLWEVGAGVAALSLPDYRGADERHAYLLPFPYFVYRGDRLRVDRSGIVAELFDSDRVELDLSFAGNFALRSQGNQARAGMPRLHPMLEGGPELVLRLAGERDARGVRLDLRLAARGALAVGGGEIRQVGWTGGPYLRLDVPESLGPGGFDLSATLGLVFSSRGYNRYLYTVDPVYATPARPAYDAAGGFSGLHAQLSAGRRISNWWLGGYLRMDSLRGSDALLHSPLVRSRHAASAGLAIAYVFAASTQEAGR